MRDRYDGPQIDLILRAAEGRVSKDRGRSLRCWSYVSAYAPSRARRHALRSFVHRATSALRSSLPRSVRGSASLKRMRLGALNAGSTALQDRKSTRLNSSHTVISYAVFCLKK